MKKLIVLSVVSLTMFMPQLYSISIAEYIEHNRMPQVAYGTLDLVGKRLTSLEGLQSIPNIDRVRFLNLSFNQLQELPADVFNDLPNLKELFLTNNKLETLPVGIFSSLHSLEKLYLYNNKLQELPADVFNGLNNLKDLELKKNPFRGEFILGLPNIIHGIPTLEYLDHQLIDEALEYYRVYNPKTLQESALGYLMQNLTPEQFEELAETGHSAFDLLPLSEDKRQAINKVEERKKIQFMAKALVESLGQAILSTSPTTSK